MSSNPKFIPALESLKHLRAEQGIEEKSLPLEQLGTTYVMAQCSCWLDSDNFIVGRWDGSLSIFDKTTSQMQGARITIATNTPSDQGVQMVARVGTGLFVTSNDNRTITLWQAEDSEGVDRAAACI